MECSHVFDRKQSPLENGGLVRASFRLQAFRFPSNCKAVSRPSYRRVDSRKQRMKIPAMLLLPEESSYREMGRKVKKQSGALQASESILGLKAVLFIHSITLRKRSVHYLSSCRKPLLADSNEPGECKNSKKKEKRAEIHPDLILRIICVMQNMELVK